MPLEYNWVGDSEDLAKLKRDSRRGEWEALGERKKGSGERQEEESDRGS